VAPRTQFNNNKSPKLGLPKIGNDDNNNTNEGAKEKKIAYCGKLKLYVQNVSTILSYL
jgi:hypothetical protein